MEKCSWINFRKMGKECHEGYTVIIRGDGNIIGSSFPARLEETTVIGYYNLEERGDKKLVYCADIINRYSPHLVFDNEKNVVFLYKYRLINHITWQY